jgi:hypothetical protein
MLEIIPMTTKNQPVFDVDVTKDSRVVTEMVAQFKNYLYGDALFGTMPGTLPKLTVGSLLMRLHRLDALKHRLDAGIQRASEAAQANFLSLRKEWTAHYIGKIKQEMKSRGNALSQYLTDAEENLRSARAEFPAAMEKRVMLEHLKEEAQTLEFWDEDMRNQLGSLDNRIHRVSEKHPFIWQASVAEAYPQDPFWFLYLLPPLKP